jgi:hypothetical protein
MALTQAASNVSRSRSRARTLEPSKGAASKVDGDGDGVGGVLTTLFSFGGGQEEQSPPAADVELGQANVSRLRLAERSQL